MFISLTIHFVDGRKLRTIDLACEPFKDSHTGVNIAKRVKDIIIAKGLQPKKCTGITIDNAANMMKAGEILGEDDDNNIVTVPCFCHSLQLTVHRFQGMANVKGSRQPNRPSGSADARFKNRAGGGSGAVGAAGGGGGGGGVDGGGSNDAGGGNAGCGGVGGSVDGGDGGRAGGAGSRPVRGDSSAIKSVLTLCNEIITTFTRSPEVSVVCISRVNAVSCRKIPH